MKKTIALSFFLAAAILFGMTVNGSLDILGTLTAAVVNFGSSTTTQPNKTGTTAPGTCSVGQTFFDSDATAGSNMLLCTAPNTWTPVSGGGSGSEYDPTSVQWMHHKEEFPSAIWQQSNGANTGWHVGENAWYFESNGGTGASVQPEVPSTSDAADGPAHPGRWKVQSGGTTSQWGELKLASYAAENPWFSASKLGTKFVWVFRLGTTTQQTVYIGLARDGNIATSNFIGVRYDSTTAATNFYLTARTYGGTAGEFDSGVAGDSTTWHTLVGRVDATTANKIWLSLDGGTEKSFCASGCDVAATVSGLVFTTSVRVQTKESVNKYVVLDYYGAKSQISATEVRP